MIFCYPCSPASPMLAAHTSCAVLFWDFHSKEQMDCDCSPLAGQLTQHKALTHHTALPLLALEAWRRGRYIVVLTPLQKEGEQEVGDNSLY